MNKVNKFKMYKKAFGEKNLERLAYGERLGPVITEQRKTIVELRDLLGVSYEMARRYVTGAGRPSWDKNVKIANWLGLDPDWLAYGTGSKDAPDAPKTVPVYKLGDRVMETSTENMVTPTTCDFAIRVNNSMAAGLASGDIVFCVKTESFDAGDSVLLKAIDPKSFVPHMIRKVVFGPAMTPIFRADNAAHPDVTLETYQPIAKVVASLRNETAVG